MRWKFAAQRIDHLERLPRAITQTQQHFRNTIALLCQIVAAPSAIGLRSYHVTGEAFLVLRKQPHTRAVSVAELQLLQIVVTQSPLYVRASYFCSRPLDCFLNASITASLSGDLEPPGRSGGEEASDVFCAKAFPCARSQTPAEAEPNRRTASRRVIICLRTLGPVIRTET